LASWRDVAAGAPELAAAAERIFRSFTLAYLATVRADGGPRVHPVTITLHGGELWVFLVRGTPKRRDLLHDPRYALHSFPVLRDGSYASYVDEEVVLFGTAAPVEDAAVRAEVAAAHNDTVHDGDLLFRLDIERAQHKTRRDGRAVYTRWPDET
jgi:hypothetical protein